MDANEESTATALPKRRSVRPNPARKVEAPSPEEFERAKRLLERLTGGE